MLAWASQLHDRIKSVFFKSPILFFLASSQNDLYYHKKNCFFGKNNLILFEGAFLKCGVIILEAVFRLVSVPRALDLRLHPHKSLSTFTVYELFALWMTLICHLLIKKKNLLKLPTGIAISTFLCWEGLSQQRKNENMLDLDRHIPFPFPGTDCVGINMIC